MIVEVSSPAPETYNIEGKVLNQDNQDWDIKPQRTQRDAEKDEP